MPIVKIVKIPFTYEKPEPNKVTVFDLVDIENKIDHKVGDKKIVKIRPQGYGGNHYHERIETWVAIGGELELAWIESGEKKSMIMNPKDTKEIFLITIDRNVPHVVRNNSEIEGILFEYADEKETNAKLFDVINSTCK